MSKFGICLHADLFGGRNTLLSIRGYQYGAIFIDEVTHMRFSIIVKLKNCIYEKNKIIFNKIEIYLGKKMHYFQSNNVGEYQLLISYFEDESIIWEKFAPYA